MNMTLNPLPAGSWTRVHAAHLLARAGFGASPADIEVCHARGMEAAVEALFSPTGEWTGPEAPEWVKPGIEILPDPREIRSLSEEERRKVEMERRREQALQMGALRGWWFDRMRNGPDPLREKLVLFWHGHFATSVEKVRQPYALYLQNRLFRERALGSWREFIVAVSKDPAMLIYLDNARSRAGNPNENYARELLELFTLGEGNYTEDDVKAAARALTGHGLARGRMAYEYRARNHDGSEKTFLGRTGKLGLEEIADQILAQPVAARFITGKLWTFFAGMAPGPELAEALASSFTRHQGEFRPFLREMFRSEAFYAREVVSAQVKSPVQWLVGMARELEAPLPHPAICASVTRLLGQDLFAPPNVKGWDGGIAWITTANLIHRYQLAGAFLKGGTEWRDAGNMLRRAVLETAAGMKPDGEGMMKEEENGGTRSSEATLMAEVRKLAKSTVDPSRLVPPAAERGSREEMLRLLLERLYPTGLPEKIRAEFAAQAAAWAEPKQWTEREIRDVCHRLMSTPYYQLT